MPTYDYKCASCGLQFSEFQKVTEEPLTQCPSCQKEELVKLITSGNFILKGENWFKNSGQY